MSKRGEAYIESVRKRALEKTVIAPLVPAAASLAVANSVGAVTHEVERSLFPGDSFAIRKLGDPDRDSSILRWLRRAMVDELPQILDVWDGSMTLVGPRADMPEHIDDLFAAVEDADLHDRWKEVRMRQRPGIISSYAIHSHMHNLEGAPESVRFSEDEQIAENAVLRATLDIADFNAASPMHDIGLFAATARMAATNYAHYARGVILPEARTSQSSVN